MTTETTRALLAEISAADLRELLMQWEARLKAVEQTQACHHELLVKAEPHLPDPDDACPGIPHELFQRLVGFAKDIRDDFDCDSDAHKYNTMCRACAAKELLLAIESAEDDEPDEPSFCCHDFGRYQRLYDAAVAVCDTVADWSEAPLGMSGAVHVLDMAREAIESAEPGEPPEQPPAPDERRARWSAEPIAERPWPTELEPEQEPKWHAVPRYAEKHTSRTNVELEPGRVSISREDRRALVTMYNAACEWHKGLPGDVYGDSRQLAIAVEAAKRLVLGAKLMEGIDAEPEPSLEELLERATIDPTGLRLAAGGKLWHASSGEVRATGGTKGDALRALLLQLPEPEPEPSS